MEQKISFKEKIGYGLGDAGNNFIWVTVGSFLTLYYTDSVGISAAAVGTIMLITRLLDGVSDLVMGAIIDRTSTRWGKARPWILWTAPFMALSMILLFNVPTSLGTNGKIVYVSITYVFLAVFVYTACNLAYTSLLSLMTADQQERTSISSIRYFITMIAILIVSYTATPIVDKVGWAKMAFIFGIAGFVCLLISFATTKERVGDNNEAQSREKESVVESFKILFQNKYFIPIALLFILTYASGGVANGIGIYFAKDVMGNAGVFGTLILASMMPSMVGVIFLPAIIAKIGKCKCIIIGLILQAIGFIMVAVIPTNFTLVVTGLVIKGLGMLPLMAGLFPMVADIVDYGEWKTGKRIDGLTYSAVSFGMKVGTGLGSAMVGWGLAIGGYDGTATVQSASTITAITALYSYIPLLIVVLSIVLMIFTNIDKVYPEVAEGLKTRKESRNK